MESGEAGSFVVNGNYAYVFWVGQGLRIIDIEDKSNPIIVSTYLTNLYGNTELQLSYPFLFAITEEIVQNSVEYHFKIFNISNPESLILAGDYNLTNIGIGQGQPLPRLPHKFIISGNNVYLLSAPPVQYAGKKIVQLHVLDFSSPDSVFHKITIDIGEIDMTNSYLNLDKKDTYIYVTGAYTVDRHTLKIIDFSNTSNPVISGWFDHYITVDIEVSDNYAYITDDAGGIHTVDISIPTNLITYGSVRLPIPDTIPDEFNLKVYGNRAYMYFYDNYAVYTIDLSNSNVPSVIPNTRIEMGHCLTDVSASGYNVYASVWDWKQLYVVNIETPESPVIINRSDVSVGFAWGIDVEGNYAYVTLGATAVPEISPGGLTIFDISNPESPVECGHSANDSNFVNHEVQVYVDTTEMNAYLVSGKPFINYAGAMQSENPGLRIVDVSNPDNLTELGSYYFNDTAHQCQDVFKDGNYAYIAASEGGLYIIDVSDAENPTFVYQWNLLSGNARAVFISDNYAYVAYDRNLVILDISDPTAPSQVSNYFIGASCNDVLIKNNYAFVVTSNALRVLDVQDPTNPREVVSQEDVFCSPPIHLDINDSYIYVACDGGGIYTFEFSGSMVEVEESDKEITSLYALEKNYPNPFNPKTTISFSIPKSSKVEISIYNVTGQKIKTLVNANLQKGYHEVIWNGKDEQNNPVPSGIYFYKMESDNFSEIKNAILLK